ncbi:hypothetical protein ACSS6W_003504 [Trichoderma asperelloides]
MDNPVLAQLLSRLAVPLAWLLSPRRGGAKNRGMTRFLSPVPEVDASSETSIRSGVEAAEAAAIRSVVVEIWALLGAGSRGQRMRACRASKCGESTWTGSAEIRPRIRSCQSIEDYYG